MRRPGSAQLPAEAADLGGSYSRMSPLRCRLDHLIETAGIAWAFTGSLDVCCGGMALCESVVDFSLLRHYIVLGSFLY